MINIEAWKLVDQIINEIKQGKRLHIQGNYHTITDCGTAHCIAGWYIHEKLKLTDSDYEFCGRNKETYIKEGRGINKEADTEWKVAQKDLGITFKESWEIFEILLDIDQIWTNWQELKQTYGVNLELNQQLNQVKLKPKIQKVKVTC